MKAVSYLLRSLTYGTVNLAFITLSTLPLSAQYTSNDSEIYWLGAQVRELSNNEYIAYGTTPEVGGVDLVEVPANSVAAKAGFQANDLIQEINGVSVKTVQDLLHAYAQAGDNPLEISAIRYQQKGYLPVKNAPHLIVQSVSTPVMEKGITGKISSNKKTKNDPISTLLDGQLQQGYGPVFENNSTGGAYKLELAQSTPISTITCWSYNMGGTRGKQIVTIYGSNSDSDPGWSVDDHSKFTPLASIDTSRQDLDLFTSTTLQAVAGETIGTYKWIVWQTSLINNEGENTAFQELIVK